MGLSAFSKQVSSKHHLLHSIAFSPSHRGERLRGKGALKWMSTSKSCSYWTEAYFFLLCETVKANTCDKKTPCTVYLILKLISWLRTIRLVVISITVAIKPHFAPWKLWNVLINLSLWRIRMKFKLKESVLTTSTSSCHSLKKKKNNWYRVKFRLIFPYS